MCGRELGPPGDDDGGDVPSSCVDILTGAEQASHVAVTEPPLWTDLPPIYVNIVEEASVTPTVRWCW